MDESLLTPSNNLFLSDAVIGSVSVRAHAPVYVFSPDEERPHHNHSSPDTTTLTSSQASWYALHPSERSLLLHRLRRRRTQQRYRKKQQNKALSLEENVLQLREEVKRLEEKRWIPSRNVSKTAPLKVMVEYFRLFRYGYNPIASVSELCGDAPGLHDDPGYKQTQFFKSVVMPNGRFNASYGIQTALEDWRMVSLHHESLTYNLERVENGPRGTVVAYMTGITTITEKMLLMAFPNLTGTNWTPLAAKLLGYRLEVPSQIYFLYDEVQTRVASIHYEADMLTPLLKLLLSVEEVAMVLESTLDIHHWNDKALNCRLLTGFGRKKVTMLR